MITVPELCHVIRSKEKKVKKQKTKSFRSAKYLPEIYPASFPGQMLMCHRNHPLCSIFYSRAEQRKIQIAYLTVCPSEIINDTSRKMKRDCPCNTTMQIYCYVVQYAAELK